MNIRNVKPEDAEQILAIYAPYITNSPISFETTVPDVSEIKKRISNITAKYPWIVYEIDKIVVGYAYASSHRTRCAYEWSVESSVYIDQKFHGQGIGTRLYQHLFELLRHQGAVNVFAGITLPNETSVQLHEKLGFKPIGIFNDIGFKLNKWWDVGWWQLQLQKPTQPQPLRLPKYDS